MKRILISIGLCILFVFVLVSCGNSQQQQTTENTETLETTVSHVHTFGEWTVTKEPTCEESGIRERTCSCGEKETETIPATGHDIVDGICSKCGYMPESDGLKFNLINDEYYEVSVWKCTDSVINIPGVYEGKPVLVVKDFSNRSFIEIVNIAEGVTTINNRAFYNCPKLKKVVLPTSLVTIGDGAFKISGLSEISIPNGVTSIGKEAFFETGIQEITIPQSVTYIGEKCFYNTKLVRLIDNSSCTIISESTYENCKQLSEVILSDYIVEIQAYSFSGCEKLERINVPESVTSIGDYVFQGTVIYEVTIPNSVTSIGDGAFRDCNNLTEVTIPNSVTSIGDGAFRDCKNLTEVTIPNSVTSIGDSAFRGCKKLTEIVIPNSVTSIGSESFRETGIREITIPESVTFLGGACFYDSDLIRFVDNGSFTVIEGATFEKCKQLKEVLLSNNINEIKPWAFSKCDGLESIEIPDSVAKLGSGAFSMCNSLTSITIPGTVEEIGHGAFYESGIVWAVFNEGVKIINGEVFEGCKSLEKVTLPSSIEYMSLGSFKYCTSLKDIYFNMTNEQVKSLKMCKVPDDGTYQFVIHCTDGDLDRSEYYWTEPENWTEPEYDKPIIYLYPEKDTVCTVRLDVSGGITCSYPEYKENGWANFIAKPDGTLIFPDGSEYYALYWEGIGTSVWDMSTGFCVKGSDTASFLSGILPKLGLNSREANEFIIYWLPRMQNNAYNLISFQTSAYTDNAKLIVTPTPDTVIRVFMAYMSLENPVEIEPQIIETPERNGFAIVEWGGSEIG